MYQSPTTGVVMSSASTVLIGFYTVSAEYIEASDIVHTEAVEDSTPDMPPTYKIIYTLEGSDEERIAWVDLTWFNTLKPYVLRYRARLNAEADALG